MSSSNPSSCHHSSSSHPPPSNLRHSDPPSPSPPNDLPIPDSPPATLPLPLSASVLLTSLPRDASAALSQAVQDIDGVPAKVTIRLHPIGAAPQLRQKVFRVSASNRFETVVTFLRKKLVAETGDKAASVFCYVNSVFAPGLDEGVGGLWRCFKTDDQLIVGYSLTPAFG